MNKPRKDTGNFFKFKEEKKVRETKVGTQTLFRWWQLVGHGWKIGIVVYSFKFH